MPMAAATDTGRRARLLDEALALLAAGGLGAISHRSVENAAGAPHGSVTYWFQSRNGLIEAMVDRLVTECEGMVRPIADGLEAAYAAGVQPDLDATADAVAAWMLENRELQIARFELELEAGRDERVRARMNDAAAVFWDMCVPLVRALGSDDPERDGRAMAVMVDGMLLDFIAREQPREIVTAAMRQLLRTWAPTQ